VVATDSAGNQDANVVFNAIVDHTPPVLKFDSLATPVEVGEAVLTWTAEDTLAGVDYFVLEQKLNDQAYQVINDTIPGTSSSYPVPVREGEIMIFRLTAYDRSGNFLSQRISAHTQGYVFPYDVVFPFFRNNP